MREAARAAAAQHEADGIAADEAGQAVDVPGPAEAEMMVAVGRGAGQPGRRVPRPPVAVRWQKDEVLELPALIVLQGASSARAAPAPADSPPEADDEDAVRLAQAAAGPDRDAESAS